MATRKVSNNGTSVSFLFFEDNVKVETIVVAYDALALLVEIGSSLGLWLGKHCLKNLYKSLFSNIFFPNILIKIGGQLNDNTFMVLIYSNQNSYNFLQKNRKYVWIHFRSKMCKYFFHLRKFSFSQIINQNFI